MKQATKAQLIERERLASKDRDILHLALNDTINGKVHWFRRGNHSIGVSRELSPCGGIVIHRHADKSCSYSSAYYWESWWPQVRDSMPSHTDNDAQNLRNAAIEAHAHLLKVQADEQSTKELE